MISKLKTVLLSAIGVIGVLSVTLTVITVCYQLNTYVNKSVETGKNVSGIASQSPQEYKESCQEVDYKKIARQPELYEGKNVKISGKVWQVVEQNGNALYHIYVDKSEYGYDFNSSVQIVYKNGKNNFRVLEDDIITVYGKYNGITSYTTVLGAKKSIPQISAEYIELQEADNAESN